VGGCVGWAGGRGEWVAGKGGDWAGRIASTEYKMSKI